MDFSICDNTVGFPKYSHIYINSSLKMLNAREIFNYNWGSRNLAYRRFLCIGTYVYMLTMYRYISCDRVRDLQTKVSKIMVLR